MAMGLDLDSFFDSSKYVNIVHTKSDQRPHAQLLGISMADLGVGMLDQVMTPLMLQLGPKARSGPPFSHGGQDFIYCESGELLYTVGGRAFVLEPGDSLLFDGRLPHRFQNTGSEMAEVLIVLSAPRDSAGYVADHFPEESVP